MSIEVLSDVIAPNSLWSEGVQGKQMRFNARGQNSGGFRQINIVRAQTLRQYDFTNVPLMVSDWQRLEGLHEVTEGGAYGFLVLDPKDSRATHENGRATLISSIAGTYQLVKRYTSAGSSRTKDRNITRPIAAEFELKINGTITASYSLDADTGIITIPGSPTPTAASITWASRFYVPVHFENDDIDWDLLIAGPADTRYAAGQRIVLTEIRE